MPDPKLAVILSMVLVTLALADPGIEEEKIVHVDRDKSRTRELGLAIDRIWSEDGFNFAQVTVKNTSASELEEITIKCTAFGPGSINLSFHEQTLVSAKQGPIVPGFSKTMEIELKARKFAIRSMSCIARGW